MFGFFFAATCAVALVYVSRRGRHHRGWGRGMFQAFSTLETTPGQEKVIRESMLTMRAEGKDLARKLRDAAPDLSELFAQEQFDEAAFERWFAARQEDFKSAEPRLLSSLKEVHEVLDSEQRKKVGRFLRNPSYGFCGPRFLHRGGHAC